MKMHIKIEFLFGRKSKLSVDGEEHSFYRKPENGLWFTSGLKTPEMLYDFCEETVTT